MGLNVINSSKEPFTAQIFDRNNHKCKYVISILIFYLTWLLNKENNSENISFKQSFDLAVDQRDECGNIGPLLSSKGDVDGFKVGLCKLINDRLEYHSPNHREIEVIAKNINNQFVPNNRDSDFMCT